MGCHLKTRLLTSVLARRRAPCPTDMKTTRLLGQKGDHPTNPVAIYRFLDTPGAVNQGQAMALSSILIVLTAVVVLLTVRLRFPGGRHV